MMLGTIRHNGGQTRHVLDLHLIWRDLADGLISEEQYRNGTVLNSTSRLKNSWRR